MSSAERSRAGTPTSCRSELSVPTANLGHLTMIDGRKIREYNSVLKGPKEITENGNLRSVTNFEKDRVVTFLYSSAENTAMPSFKEAFEHVLNSDSLISKKIIVEIPEAAEISRTSSEVSINETSYDMAIDNVVSIPKSDPQALPSSASSKKPKPIMVFGIENILEFTNYLATEKKFTFEAKLAGKFVRILPADANEKAYMHEFFKDSNIQHYLIPDREIPLKAVIRGLPKNTNSEIIKDNLIKCNFEIIKVSQLKSRRDGSPLPLFLIELPKRPNSHEIFKLKTFFQLRISVEKFRSAKKAPQCFRCQSWYHVASSCHMTPRCVRCLDQHASIECPLKQTISKDVENQLKPKCCNCQGDHPSSYKGCPNFPSKLQPKKSYAEITKAPSKLEKTKKIKQSKIQTKETPKSENQIPTVKPNSENLKEIREFASAIPTIVDLVKKLKEELQINSFNEIPEILSSVLASVSIQKDRFSKIFTFSEQLTKVANPSITNDT